MKEYRSRRPSLTLSAMLVVGSVLLCGGFFATISYGATFYVAKTGTDNNSCSQAQNQSTPRLTIRGGIGCLSAGDTLIVKSGTYIENVRNDLYFIPNGTASARVTIKANPGDTVTIQPSRTDLIVLEFINVHYITFEGFIVDAMNASSTVATVGSGSTNIRLQNNELRRGFYNGILVGNVGTNYVELIGNNIHDNGRANPCKCGYGIYGNIPNLLIERNHIHHNAYYGVHLYGPDPLYDGIIRYNRIHDNGVDYGSGAGLLVGGQRMLVYNNIVYNNPEMGIRVQYVSPKDSKIYNNSIYGITPAAGSQCGIYIGSASGIVVKNNIVSNSGTGICNYGSNTTLSNNLTTDPKFVNSAGYDFHLQSTSPAINAGANLSPDVVDDIEGNARGSAYDVGAYEYVSGGSSTLAPPSQLSVAP